MNDPTRRFTGVMHRQSTVFIDLHLQAALTAVRHHHGTPSTNTLDQVIEAETKPDTARLRL